MENSRGERPPLVLKKYDNEHFLWTIIRQDAEEAP